MNLRILISQVFMLAGCLAFFSSQLHAQFANVFPYTTSQVLSQNSSFEDGIKHWNYAQIPASVITRDWVPGAVAGPFTNYDHLLGAKLVKLTGHGVFGQFFAIRATDKFHVLNLAACRQGKDGKGAGSYAQATVQYFDPTWQMLDETLVVIDPKDARINRGIGDGLNFYSVGTFVPQGAAYATISIYNTDDTEVFVDAFYLHRYSIVSRHGLAADLIIKNPHLELYQSSAAVKILSNGLEFLESNVTLPNEGVFDGFVTPMEHDQWYYQFVPVVGARTYSMVINTQGVTGDAFVGMDCYDVNWNPIKKVAFDLQPSEPLNLVRRVELPKEVAYASVFAWVGPNSTSRPFLSLYQQSPTIDSNMSAIATSFYDFTSKAGVVAQAVSVLLSDSDGVDVASIDNNDAYFTSRTNPTKQYPALVNNISGSSVIDVQYISPYEAIGDIDSLVIRPSQIKDKRGIYLPQNIQTLTVEVRANNCAFA
ncbi:MAG: hypothetical protein U0930_13505 [Pirellulales bacterium]